MKKKFTLIELLIVAAIIGILMTLLLPALQQTRKLGQSIACVANVKQIAYAHLLYSQDNDGWAINRIKSTLFQPYIREAFTPTPTYHNCILKCPTHASTDRLKDYPGGFNWSTHSCYSYTTNAYLEAGVRFAKMRTPSETFLTADTDCSAYVQATQDAVFHFRHLSNVNMAYGDFHVKARKYAPLPQWSGYPFWKFY